MRSSTDFSNKDDQRMYLVKWARCDRILQHVPGAVKR